MSIQESGRITSERLHIETIPQAVKAIHDMHTSLTTDPTFLTEQYWQRRLLGKEGDTWDYFTDPELGRVKVPHLGQVLVSNGTVLIDSSISRNTGKLVVPYYLNPLKDTEGGVVLGDTGWVPTKGFKNEPTAYIVRPTGIISESVDGHGRTPWEPVNVQTARQLHSVTEPLRSLIRKIQSIKK